MDATKQYLLSIIGMSIPDSMIAAISFVKTVITFLLTPSSMVSGYLAGCLPENQQSCTVYLILGIVTIIIHCLIALGIAYFVMRLVLYFVKVITLGHKAAQSAAVLETQHTYRPILAYLDDTTTETADTDAQTTITSLTSASTSATRTPVTHVTKNINHHYHAPVEFNFLVGGNAAGTFGEAIGRAVGAGGIRQSIEDDAGGVGEEWFGGGEEEGEEDGIED